MARFGRRFSAAAKPAGAGCALLALSARSADAQSLDLFAGTFGPQDILFLSLYALTLGAIMIAAVWLIRQRATICAENDTLRAALADAQAEAESGATILAADDQLILVYSGQGAPQCFGSLPASIAVPADAQRFRAFADWMPADTAASLTTCIDRLKAAAEPFRQEIALSGGAIIEVAGRTVGGLAVVRFQALHGLREELGTLRDDSRRYLATVETLQALADTLDSPLWLRDREDRLVWVNSTYARAVESSSVAEVLERQVEFLNSADGASIARERRLKGAFSGKATAVVAADRRTFQVIEAAGPLGSAGLAIDISGAELARDELRRTVESHSATLDHLTTAVAGFDEKTQLVYTNAAFQKLFGLTDLDLATIRDHVSLLDQLRSRGILPEDRPLRVLKEETLTTYRATEPTEAVWYLADGRTLRVFANPEPKGGTTWLFEDLTPIVELESRLNSLVRLQGETLDFLNEAVAVFGQDGRLRLSNPVFAKTWGLGADFVKDKPHIRAIADEARISILAPEEAEESIGWGDFVRAVTAFDEGPREPESGEFELSDGSAKIYSVVPLPNGQTMLTFVDVTDARKAERMLREKNEALQQAYEIKNDFVKHVNYELRSPLTNIIGFSALLRSADTGPLNTRQSEYLDYISTSTSTLLTIINDILDLATIDAGIMELELSDVDIAKTVAHATEAIRDRLREHDITLNVDIDAAGETFRADGHRLTQILFNLLSNAVNFAPIGSEVDLKGWRDGDTVAFCVVDRGPGIAPHLIAKVFDRFEADPVGGRQSGAGLGLSIVKSFVELHRGSITIEPGKEGGTVVTCRFPADEPKREAAE
ncbi:sensor histidine kinase [Consotaella salsifontis]|uniref:sensor histidine kinase n=1 Tax=Consotaella salsifontis TaxID=1365950 RepID=UPI00099A95DD|nr:PAS domain-containing sensor histidine kinase [Consotaella salsifontis]